MVPYFHEWFDDFGAAKRFQVEKLQWCLDNDYAIRTAEIHGERDFDTKAYRWSVLVRAIEVVDDPAATTHDYTSGLSMQYIGCESKEGIKGPS